MQGSDTLFEGDFISSTMQRRTDKWSFVDVDISETPDTKVMKEENEKVFQRARD
jgi:hypothetical protein